MFREFVNNIDFREKGHLAEAMAMIPQCKGFDAILENHASANLAIDLGALALSGRIAVSFFPSKQVCYHL